MKRDPHGIQRRVTIPYNIRLDGITDILQRAKGASVLDIGCNRGMVAYEFMLNGASIVCGIDNYAKGIETAQEVFADVTDVASRFLCRDLVDPQALHGLAPFDIVLVLAVYHKLRRVMRPGPLGGLMESLAILTSRYLVWSGETAWLKSDGLESIFEKHGLTCVHWSHLSHPMTEVNTIWQRLG